MLQMPLGLVLVDPGADGAGNFQARAAVALILIVFLQFLEALLTVSLFSVLVFVLCFHLSLQRLPVRCFFSELPSSKTIS